MSAMQVSYMNTANVQETNLDIFNKLMIMTKSGSIINLFICVISGLMYYFQIAERELFFKIQADNYLKLNNIIILELSVHKKNIEETFTRFVIQEFTFLVENMNFRFPSFIKKGIKNTYKTYNIPPYLDVYIHEFSLVSRMINIKNKRLCKYCDIREDTQNVCKDCKKINNKKEWSIVRYLRKEIHTKFEYNSSKMLQGCSKKRPDVYFELNYS